MIPHCPLFRQGYILCECVRMYVCMMEMPHGENTLEVGAI